MGTTSFSSVKIVKGGSISGDEKASGTLTGTDTYYPFGGTADLWGETWSDSDINASDFGVGVSFVGSGYPVEDYTTYYLTATNFGFSIPAGATIVGIKAEIEAAARVSGFNFYADIDHMRITVYYTGVGGDAVVSGNVGIGTTSPTAKLSVVEKGGMSGIGGFCVKLTNTTGANTVQGQTVKADTATDDAVILTAADDDECMGVFLESGIADDAEAWVVVAGIADVAMGDNEAATHGNWVETNSAEAGYADATAASPAAAPQHFNEIGHCIESVAAGGGGTHILARCVLHFN